MNYSSLRITQKEALSCIEDLFSEQISSAMANCSVNLLGDEIVAITAENERLKGSLLKMSIIANPKHPNLEGAMLSLGELIRIALKEKS